MSIALAILGALAAFIFTIVPLLPGTLFVLLAAILVGFVDGFDTFSTTFWVGQTVLAVLYLISDNIAQLFGVQRVGGSKQAMIAATVGTFLGGLALAPLGPLGLILGPPAGAVIGAMVGELRERKDRDQVLKVGLGSLIAYVLGTALKLGLVAAQITWLMVSVL